MTTLAEHIASYPEFIAATGLTVEAIVDHLYRAPSNRWSSLPGWKAFRQNVKIQHFIAVGNTIITRTPMPPRSIRHPSRVPTFEQQQKRQEAYRVATEKRHARQALVQQAKQQKITECQQELGYLNTDESCASVGISRVMFLEVASNIECKPLTGRDTQDNYQTLWSPNQVEAIRCALETTKELTTEEAARRLGITPAQFRSRLEVDPLRVESGSTSDHKYVRYWYSIAVVDQVRCSLRLCPLGKRCTKVGKALDEMWPKNYMLFIKGNHHWCPLCNSIMEHEDLLVHFDWHLEQGDNIRLFYLNVANKKNNA